MDLTQDEAAVIVFMRNNDFVREMAITIKLPDAIQLLRSGPSGKIWEHDVGDKVTACGGQWTPAKHQNSPYDGYANDKEVQCKISSLPLTKTGRQSMSFKIAKRHHTGEVYKRGDFHYMCMRAYLHDGSRREYVVPFDILAQHSNVSDALPGSISLNKLQGYKDRWDLLLR